MKEIKFRGKSKETGKWLYGYLAEVKRTYFNTTFIDKVIFDNLAGYNTDNFIFVVKDSSVEENTIGQFTGLKDKKGKEIYEGDIVKWDHDGLLYVIIFEDGMFYASVEECNKGIYGGFPLYVFTAECEIVGNIYDTENLLNI